MSSRFSFPVESEQMLHALRERQEAAFVSLFKAYYPLLLNYAGRIIRDEEQANDIVQETFCRLFENSEKISVHVSLKSYLYKTVYNHCIDLLRHRKIAASSMEAGMMDFYISRVIQLPESELALYDRELGEAIEGAIGHLPERCREVFRLSKICDLSNKQIAEQLGISVKTVENQMTTAYERLREELKWLLLIIIFQNF